MNWGEIAALAGTALGSGVLGSFLKGWFAARSAKRADASDSADHHARLNMLKEAQAERDAAERDLKEERKERLISDKALVIATADCRRLQDKVDSRDRVIAYLRKLLKKKGVEDSDYMPLIETELGPLGPPPP